MTKLLILLALASIAVAGPPMEGEAPAADAPEEIPPPHPIKKTKEDWTSKLDHGKGPANNGPAISENCKCGVDQQEQASLSQLFCGNDNEGCTPDVLYGCKTTGAVEVNMDCRKLNQKCIRSCLDTGKWCTARCEGWENKLAPKAAKE